MGPLSGGSSSGTFVSMAGTLFYGSKQVHELLREAGLSCQSGARVLLGLPENKHELRSFRLCQAQTLPGIL